MDFNNILIGSANPQALVDYYKKAEADPPDFRAVRDSCRSAVLACVTTDWK